MGKSSAVTIALAVLCFALGWMIYEEAKAPLPVMTSPPPAVSADPTPDSAKFASRRTTTALPPIDAFQEITARPLFNASRRPIVADRIEPVAKEAELNIMLSGIVIDHTRQIAHLRSNTDKRVQALSVGDQIDSWRIEAIEPDRVVLRAGDRVETLFIQKFGSQDAAGRPNDRPSRPGINSRRSRIPDLSGWRSRTAPPRRQPRER